MVKIQLVNAKDKDKLVKIRLVNGKDKLVNGKDTVGKW